MVDVFADLQNGLVVLTCSPILASSQAFTGRMVVSREGGAREVLGWGACPPLSSPEGGASPPPPGSAGALSGLGLQDTGSGGET